jgi:uncharacterized protein YdiU (UPF0061 family)
MAAIPHFDEDDALAVAHHQVEFTDLEARIARERPQTRREQVRGRSIFRRLAANKPTVEALHHAFYKAIDGPAHERIKAWLATYAERVAVEGIDEDERAARMNAINPLYVPRNYVVQEVIEATERGDRTKLGELLDVLRRPYDEQPGRAHFAGKRPEWAASKPGCSMLSCSS